MPNKRPCPVCYTSANTLDLTPTGGIICTSAGHNGGQIDACPKCHALMGSGIHVCYTTKVRVLATGVDQEKVKRPLPRLKECMHCKKPLRKPGQFCIDHTSIANKVRHRMSTHKGLGFRQAYLMVLNEMATEAAA